MKHTPISKDINVENCHRMADYIETVPDEQIDMRRYIFSCGTVGCFVGHCAMRLGRVKTNIEANGWAYKFSGIGISESQQAWNWCFTVHWQGVDSTGKGAAQRMRYMLANGLPEEWGYDQATVDLYMNWKPERKPTSKDVIRNLVDDLMEKNLKVTPGAIK